MANRYQTLDSGKSTLKEATDTSTGVAEAGDIVALDANGKLDVSLLPTGVGPDIKIAPASENLSAGDYVNFFDAGSGVVNVRLADNSNGRDAHGFVLDAVTSPANATVYFEGANTAAATGTPGERVYLGTAGGVITTPLNPATSSGSIHQLLGSYIDTNEINTDIDDCIAID